MKFTWANAARLRRVASERQRDIYFGKELKQLSLSEAATLAGMIQSPGRYSPLHNPEAAQARRNIVLDAMMRNGWISAAELDASAKKPVVVADAADTNSIAPYFVDYVNRNLGPRR